MSSSISIDINEQVHLVNDLVHLVNDRVHHVTDKVMQVGQHLDIINVKERDRAVLEWIESVNDPSQSTGECKRR